MLTFLHIVYSKNRTEGWGCCAAKKKQERCKKCVSHDDQSWHVTVRQCDSVTSTVPEFMFCKVRVWKGYFCYWLRENWPTLTSSAHRTTTKFWIPPFFVPATRISRKILPPLTCFLWNLGSYAMRKLCYLPGRIFGVGWWNV